jgi:hypothetical protein
MDDYLQLLIDNQRILGEFDASKVSGLTPKWFWDRWIDLIDFRGNLQIRTNNLVLGRKVCIITASHIVSSGAAGNWSKKRVWIEDNVYIGSRSLLYNCVIHNNAVVACGSVVRDMIVPAFTMVEGNPARICGKFEDGMWRRVENSHVGREYLSGLREWEEG